MSILKRYKKRSVFLAAKNRISYTFDNFKHVYVSFSGGKDSTVMMHMVMDEAVKRNRTVGILLIDLEGQYKATMEHVDNMLKMYEKNIKVHWVCLPMLLRNAVTQFEPRWCCWDPEAKDMWARHMPTHKGVISDINFFPFFETRMEFEEFMVLFGKWYGNGEPTAAFVGIRCDESLNRFRTIASNTKKMHGESRFTTEVEENLYNIYPLYDWKTSDIWIYHAKNPDKPHNKLYDLMHLAGLKPAQMRICQPYGDDQRRGLWLFHLIEPQTWARVVARVNGANSGALYIGESGNINGYRAISKPEGHTWKSFCTLLLASLPRTTQEHYTKKFKEFIVGWKRRGYYDGIPEEAPRVLEEKHWAPSYRRLCKVLLRNDWWCKGLGLAQPKSAAYQKYIELKRRKKNERNK